MMTEGGRKKIHKDRKDFIDNAVETTENKEYTTKVDEARSEGLKT
jgi:hypothetical protein